MKKANKKRLPIATETIRTLHGLELQLPVAGMASGSLNNGDALTCCCNGGGGGGGGGGQKQQ